MKLNTLNTLIDDILLEVRNSTISESEHLSRIQVEQWIHNYRAMLIKQDIDKGRDINPMYLQNIPNIGLKRIETVPGNIEFVGNKDIPKLIDFHYRTGLINVKDMYGNLIEIGDQTKNKYQKYRKFTSDDNVAYLKQGKLYVSGKFNTLQNVSVDIIAENPADVIDNFDPDQPYPVPANMIPAIKDLIFNKELNIMMRVKTDDSNDSNDQTQNKN